MPVVTLRLDETAKSIKSSMYQQLVKDVIDSLGVEYDHLTTVFTGMEVSRTDNDTSVSNQTRVNLPSTISQRRVIAKVTSRYDEDSITPTVVTQQDNPPIYMDNMVDTYMSVIYIKSDTTIDIEYTCPSESEAERLLDDIRVRLSLARNILNHTVEYNIILPVAAEDFIGDVYDLKNRLVPCTLSQYVKEYVTDRAHEITDLTDTANSRFAIRERQSRIWGVFDFSPLPDAIERNNDTNTYKLTVSYKVKLDIPTQLWISYPTMIANRPMPYKYLEFVKEGRLKAYKESQADVMCYSKSLFAMSGFESQRQLRDRIHVNLPFALPMFDEYDAQEPHPGYVMMSSVLSSVDETDKRSLFNLKEIDTDYCLNSEFLRLLAATELKYAVKPYETFFFFGLHQSGKHFDNDILEITADLDVKSKVDLTLLKPVRVGMSLCVDPSMIRRESFDRICQNRDLAIYYFTELMLARAYHPRLMHDKAVSSEQLCHILVGLCVQGCQRNEHVFLKDLVDLLRLDTTFANQFAVYVYSDYPLLYRCLNKHTVIKHYRDDNNLHAWLTANNNYAMRTVMSTYVDVQTSSGVISGSSKVTEPSYI